MLLTVTVALVACSKVPERAARYAVSEQAFAGAAVPLAELPHRLCVRNAQYAYLSTLVEPLAPAALPPWSEWYAKTDAGDGTWKAQCDGAEALGQALRGVLRALRLHAHALGALAASRSFDTSGLQKLAAGAGTVTAMGGFKDAAAKITDAGNGLSSAAGVFLQWYRAGKLENAIAASDDGIARVAKDLREVVGVARMEIETVQRKRRLVVGMMRAHEWKPADAPGHVIGQGFELATDFDTELAREQTSLDRATAAIDALASGHHMLASLARGTTTPADVDATLDALDGAVDDLLDEEWNR